MATAYRHMGLGSPLQVMAFLSQRLGELREMDRRLSDEFEMWSLIDARPGDAVPSVARGHLRRSKSEIQHILDDARHEASILKELLEAMHPCDACKGSGTYTVSHAQDEVRQYPCESCKGSGIKPPA